MRKFQNLSDTAKYDLISIFIGESKRKRKKLMDALLRCSTAEDQSPAETLRAAIDSITNTISALRAGTKTLDDLKRFHLSISLPVSDLDNNVYLTVELTQKQKSHPIPLSHFIEVKPPFGDAARTPVFKKRFDNYTYTHTFDLGERNPRQIELLRSSDLKFSLFHKSIVLGKSRNVLKALATAPLSPLTFSLNSTAPLIFMMLDGQKTNILFDARISVSAPLVSADDLLIDETIDVIHD
ncbi:hypothetical protein TRFO_04975 [Tritrichomonas foetus]|uniref:Uncharacterized protein n=1 Tax=Tritrichomonas foetus TaxID=1144522 RepID=A0A1J4KG68_9EUKA|nr:hypothetical protein TRFO_04975 [Tritrichomonas foetus]|eukprot:OHT08341.1 hypothetical protein TRFO_04975 [Tritrichomonas foetus]